MPVPDQIFKAYDIRGHYPTEVNSALAKDVGNRLVAMLDADKVLVLHDARTSGPELAEAVVQGIEQAGAAALIAGPGPTDLFYYGCAMLDCPGIMVTASHNPADQNGFKIIRKMPFALSYEEGLQELRQRINNDAPCVRAGGERIATELESGFVDYIERTLGRFEMPRPAVIDTGNGASGPALLKIRDRLRLNVDVLFAEPDGRFPNRGPDPMNPENLAALGRRVREIHAIIGAAVDGDGDRAVAVDSQGTPVQGDFMAALLAKDALQRMPGAPVLYDVRCSRAVQDTVESEGGKPLVNRVGHVYMKKRLHDEEAAFAGELSGHYYFPEFFGADSGLLAALYMVRLASQMEERWEEKLNQLRNRYHVSGEINFRVRDASACLERLCQKFKGAVITDLDGLTFDFGPWWFNVRKSNTEPLLRLNLEASSQEEMRRHLEEVRSVLVERQDYDAPVL